MNLENYAVWVVANYSSDEGRAFMLGIGMGVFVVMIRWGLRLLKQGGNKVW